MSELPTFSEETKLISQGFRLIAGIDEAGRGALAGPVVAAAVILPQYANFPWLSLVRDSKQVSPARRETLATLIQEGAIDTGIGIVPSQIIDSTNIVRATKVAMQQAVKKLIHLPDFLLIDYLTIPKPPISQKGIVKGDELCISIACASIIAKVTRDHIMVNLDQDYPDYGLARHKGYGTSEHLTRLRQLGPSPIHRFSFAPVRKVAKTA